MKVILDYFGHFIFAFVIFVGGLVALPELTPAPKTSLREFLGMSLAFVVITGGFSWYYFATAPPSESESDPRSSPRR